MATNVGVNQLSVVHKGSGGTASFMPDVCLTPQPSGPPVPVPYPNTAQSSDADKAAKTVTCDGNPICVQGSTFRQSTGDEAGSNGGVASACTKGAAEFVGYSFDVQAEGKGVARFSDLMLGNKGSAVNTPPMPEMQAPFAPAVAIDPDDAEEEEAPREELRSSVALDELAALAQAMEEREFLFWLTITFGADVPESAQRSLRDALLNGSLPVPEIEVLRAGLRGHLAGYDRATRRILVHVDFVHRALQSPDDAWALFSALLEEFGHHVDHLLRNEYSSVGGDARADEGVRVAYALANLGWGEQDRATIATHADDEGEAPIEIDVSGLHAAIERYMNRAEEEDDATDGDLEFFGPGKGSGRAWSFGHESIEDTLGQAGFDPQDRRRVYFGNWLRDFSQIVDPKITRREDESPATYRFKRTSLTRIVDILARSSFDDTPDFEVTTARLGVYRNEEHIDNPKGIEDARSIDADFRGRWTDEELRAPQATLMKQYIRSSAPAGARAPAVHQVRDGESLDSIARANGLSWQELARHNFGTDVPEKVNERLVSDVGCTRKIGANYVFTSNDRPGRIRIPGSAGTLGSEKPYTALAYVSKQLRAAVAAGETAEGYRLLGQGLHTLEDYYAHTNFIEVALCHLGHGVEAWVPMARTGARVDARTLPITSGMFGGVDTAASLLLGVCEALGKALECEAGKPTKATLIALVLLDDLKWEKSRNWLGGFSGLVNELEKKYPKVATFTCSTLGVVMAFFKYVVGAQVRLIANQIDDAQTTFIQDPNTNDPTHSQVSKDHDDHPLHQLASQLAGAASATVAGTIRRAWTGAATADDVVRAAAQYVLHPAHIAPGSAAAWVLDEVGRWARRPGNRGALERLSSRSWMLDWTKQRKKEWARIRGVAGKLYGDNKELMERAMKLVTGGSR